MRRADERTHDAAERAAEALHGIAESGRKRYDAQHEKASRKVRKLERKLEKASQRLPVDTPLDRRRRRRNTERAEKGGLVGAVLALVAGAAGYLVWRARRAAQAVGTDRSPGGVTVTQSGANGETAPELTSPTRR